MEELLDVYKTELCGNFINHEIYSYNFGCPDLGLEAIVVRVN